MASFGRLQHIFEDPLPEKPTLLQSLSLNQIKPVKPIDNSSFTELFGELHFKEGPTPFSSSSSLVPSVSDSKQSTPETNHTSRHNSDSFSSLNSESLHFCTEGLGSESSDDVEDLKTGTEGYCWEDQSEKVVIKKKSLASEDSYGEYRKSRVSGVEYPPPISCIGRSGKPWVWFKSYRENGRFVLEEIRIPTRECLQACREDGRLKLRFVLPDDEALEEKDEEEEDDDHVEGIDHGVESIDEGEEKEVDV